MPLLSNLITTISLVSLLLSVPFSTSQEVDNEKEFSYDEESPKGPQHWGQIHEAWAACGRGRAQSPIDILCGRVQIDPSLGTLQRYYTPSNATLKNRGHDIMLQWEADAGALWIGGTKYDLKQLHWHSPSEHAINGQRYSLEMHMVHQSADQKIAVVGILYKTGRSDPFIAGLEPYIKKIANTHEAEEKVGVVDPSSLKRGGRSYYRYMGSLTTPPCTEGVVWTIIKKVRTVSEEQVHLLREAVNDGFEMNARPIQKINDRIVSLYQPRKLQILEEDIVRVETY
ncbi:alpha carbonic anhydrase 7-like [Ananas comosus]|uniref:Carbonic anhydrase n=1 Tax=Ananas comosus TaxID=4615 RepID=A0A6P5GSW4_ANACO|nr:alpha carbonic anhydrase 7-like [Ananas comosus]